MDKQIRRKIFQNMINAYKGRKLWLKINKDYDLTEKDYIILMPALNDEYNYYALLYINQFIKKSRAERIIILTHDHRIKKVAHLFSDKIHDIIDFSREESELIMKFYCLYKFTNKLIIASLEEPEGRNGIKLIDKRGITLEEILVRGIYGIKKFVKEIHPKYDGNDEEIKKFLIVK